MSQRFERLTAEAYSKSEMAELLSQLLTMLKADYPAALVHLPTQVLSLRKRYASLAAVSAAGFFVEGGATVFSRRSRKTHDESS
jgi:hypothetical protein